MIVLLDMQEQALTLYGEKGQVEVPFSQAGRMFDYIEGDSVMYVTKAIEVNPSEIINLIKQMGVKIEDDVIDTGIRYIHTPGEGSIYINENLTFRGKFDYKILDSEMQQIIENNPLLKNLIKNNKIEIIGERKRASLDRQARKLREAQMEMQNLSDSQLDDMIVQGSAVEHARSGGGGNLKDHSSAISIDLERGGRVEAGAGASFNTMSEMMNKIDGKG
jgi:hypothetical protein